jgi:hypothetical protein
MSENKDETLGPVTSASYNEALEICRGFLSNDEKETRFFVYPEESRVERFH